MDQPTFRLHELFEQDFQEKLFRWFTLIEVLNLEAVSSRSCEALRRVSLWEQMACRKHLPRFRMPVPSPSTGDSRNLVRSVITNLRGAKISRDTRHFNLRTFGLAQELAVGAARARKVAARHRAEQRAFAEIVVAKFYFPKGTALDGAGLYISSSIQVALTFGGVQQVWELQLAFAEGAVFVASRRRDRGQQPLATANRLSGPGGDGQGFFADLHSVSDSVVLRLYDMHIHPSCGWEHGQGLISVRNNGKVSPSTALTEGLLCVLCLRGVPSKEALALPYRSLNAMNLDAPYSLSAMDSDDD